MSEAGILVLRIAHNFGKKTCISCCKKIMCSKWVSGIEKGPEMIFLDRSIRVIFLCSECDDAIFEKSTNSNYRVLCNIGSYFYEECKSNPSGNVPIHFHKLDGESAIDLNKQVDTILLQRFFSPEFIAYIDSKKSQQQ